MSRPDGLAIGTRQGRVKSGSGEGVVGAARGAISDFQWLLKRLVLEARARLSSRAERTEGPGAMSPTAQPEAHLLSPAHPGRAIFQPPLTAPEVDPLDEGFLTDVA